MWELFSYRTVRHRLLFGARRIGTGDWASDFEIDFRVTGPSPDAVNQASADKPDNEPIPEGLNDKDNAASGRPGSASG
jgi:hypothetical protein